jgi:site-specific recombinase XerD
VLDAWQESWLNLSPTTAAGYQTIVANYLRPAFGQLPIAQVTHEVVQRYVNGLAAEHAPGTVRNVYACLRNACSRGVRMGLARVNPCTKIDLPSSPREEMLFLTADEVRALAEEMTRSTA